MAKNESGEVEIEEVEELPEVKEGEEDTTDWKALALRNQGIAKRNATKLKRLKETKETPIEPQKISKEEGFDYAELSYLEVKGVSEEDHEYVLETIKDSGKSLKDLLGSKWFQSDLKERRESRVSKNAIPSGTKRSTSSARDSVEYYANKPFSEVPKELKRDVLAARKKTASSANKFTDTPVAD